jgi:CRISPR-associated endonuclease/helicase Cas3
MEPEPGEDGEPSFGNDQYVYGEYLLLRTWLALQGKGRIGVPSDVEGLIEEVYGDHGALPEGALGERLSRAKEKDSQRRERLEFEADSRLLRPPSFDDEFVFFAEMEPGEEDDPTVHRAFRALTRYEDRPSVTVVCLRTADGGVAVETESVALPVDLAAPPGADLTAKLMQRTVNLTGVAARHFISNTAAPGWQHSALLRHLRPAVFDGQGVIHADRLTLRLDADLGVIIESRTDEGDDE